MGSAESKCSDDQEENIFRNHVIMYEVLRNLPPDQIREMRRVTKTANSVGSRIHYSQEHKVRPLRSGKDVTEFLDRVSMRIYDAVPFSAFELKIDAIPLDDIQRFSVEMEGRVRKLTVEFTKSPPPPQPPRSTWNRVWTDWWSAPVPAPTAPPPAPIDRKNGIGTKAKAIGLLSGLSQNLEELHFILRDDRGGICSESLLTQDDLRSLPRSFPRLTHFRCQYIDWELGDVQAEEEPQDFFSYIFSQASHLDHVTLSAFDLTQSFRKLPALLSRLNRPGFPVSLGVPLRPSMTPDHAAFLRELIEIGYNQLRTFRVAILPLNDDVILLVNSFLNLQRESLETLCLFAFDYDEPNHEFILPNLPRLKHLSISGKADTTIPPFASEELFPNLEQVTLGRLNQQSMQPWFTENVRVVVTDY